MKVQEDNELYDEINVVPMLDLAYVLLVIFIIMTTASVQGIKVNLPKASNTPSLAKPQTKAITINEAGQIFLDAYPVTMDELRTRLSQLKAANPELPVVIKGRYGSAIRQGDGGPRITGPIGYYPVGPGNPAPG